jgi:protein FAM50
MSKPIQRLDAGVHLVEGNLAGPRAAALAQKRQRDQEDFEARLAKQTRGPSRFVGSSAASQIEQDFKAQTVGLVTADEFKRAAKESLEGKVRDETAASIESEEVRLAREKKEKKEAKKRLKEKKKQLAVLSFAGEEEAAEETEIVPKRGMKDPTVDTHFLPDKQRDLELEAERKRLEAEWKVEQEKIKNERLEIVYSYWDGSGHRREVEVVKKNTIGEFLEKARQSLCKEFRELAVQSADALLYVKEDLIIPQDMTFYDLIVTKVSVTKLQLSDRAVLCCAVLCCIV